MAVYVSVSLAGGSAVIAAQSIYPGFRNYNSLGNRLSSKAKKGPLNGTRDTASTSDKVLRPRGNAGSPRPVSPGGGSNSYGLPAVQMFAHQYINPVDRRVHIHRCLTGVLSHRRSSTG